MNPCKKCGVTDRGSRGEWRPEPYTFANRRDAKKRLKEARDIFGSSIRLMRVTRKAGR